MAGEAAALHPFDSPQSAATASGRRRRHPRAALAAGLEVPPTGLPPTGRTGAPRRREAAAQVASRSEPDSACAVVGVAPAPHRSSHAEVWPRPSGEQAPPHSTCGSQSHPHLWHTEHAPRHGGPRAHPHDRPHPRTHAHAHPHPYPHGEYVPWQSERRSPPSPLSRPRDARGVRWCGHPASSLLALLVRTEGSQAAIRSSHQALQSSRAPPPPRHHSAHSGPPAAALAAPASPRCEGAVGRDAATQQGGTGAQERLLAPPLPSECSSSACS